MRAQRLESMKQEHKKRQEWLANGNQKIRFFLCSILIFSFQYSRSW
jgi:hypothetical protein